MRFAKKIAVLMLIAVLLISSSAFFTSADFTEDNIEDVLEYYLTSVFVREDLNALDAEGVHESLLYSTHQMVQDPKNSENSVWYIVPGDMRNANLTMGLGDELVGKLVLSTRLMLGAPLDDGDENTVENAPNLNFNITLHKANGLWDQSTFFAIDAKGGEIAYYSYNEQSGRLDKKNVLNVTPVYDSWYELDFVLNLEKGTYSFNLVNGETEIAIKDVSVGPFVKTSEVRMLLKESRRAQLWLDQIDLYEGSFLRDTSEAGKNATAIDYLKKLDALSKTDISLATRLRIAEVYKILLIENNFQPELGIDGYDEVLALIAEDIKYINRAYKDALVYYVSAIDTSKTYTERCQHLELLDGASALLPVAEEEFLLCPGMTGEDYATVTAERAKIEAERAALAALKQGSEAYIAKAGEYDDENKDYAYMKQYMSEIVAIENVDESYPGLKEAKAASYTLLSLKIAEIERICNDFIERVDRMNVIISAVPEHGVCGDSFEELYYTLYCDSTKDTNTVLGAESLYNGGVLFSGLDNATYPALTEKIALYLTEAAYIQSRVEASEAFITYVRLAKSATQYNIILDKIELAAKCIDDDLTEFTVEDKYKGVSEARADYAIILQRLKASEAAAKLYVAEAAKVSAAMDKGYNTLKAALASALLLKEDGDVAGMEGVKEANIILSEAEAIIKSYEGFSKTLIDAVTALDNEELSISERRAYITAANNAKAKSTDEISGVSDAKTKLTAAIAKYDADIAAANAAFVTELSNAVTVSVSVATHDTAPNAVLVFSELFK